MFPSVSTQNPNSVATESELESKILSFLSFPDSPFLSNSRFFDRVLHEFHSPSAADDDSVQDQLIDRTLQRVSLLLDSTKRLFHKRRTLHNSVSWFLPPALTFKVFSLLDTKSLMQVAACCTMFNKYAMDPFCYSHIDLTTASELVDDGVLRTMIHRAGKELRSLRLGHVANERHSLFLTSTCLSPLLSSDRDFTGNPLRSLHLYNLFWLEKSSLYITLSACSNLTDLKIVGLNEPLELVLELVTRRCRLIKHLFLHNFYTGDITDSTIEAFVTNCTDLTSLTLINFQFNDVMARILVKGFGKLKYMNLSSIFGIDGSFLRDLGSSCIESPLDTLILRDILSLKEREVLQFLNSLIAGDFRTIRYIDVSSCSGLVCDGNGIKRTSEPKFPLEKLKEERSDIKFVAEFP